MEFFNTTEQERITDAIEQAENRTSGEIRVCLSKRCPGEAIQQATVYFEKLGMHKTALKTGVLIFLAIEDRKFAIIGDKGINERVPENFWNASKEAMQRHFKKGDFLTGILTGIHSVSDQLQKFFPREDDDINELPNDVVHF